MKFDESHHLAAACQPGRRAMPKVSRFTQKASEEEKQYDGGTCQDFRSLLNISFIFGLGYWR